MEGRIYVFRFRAYQAGIDFPFMIVIALLGLYRFGIYPASAGRMEMSEKEWIVCVRGWDDPLDMHQLFLITQHLGNRFQSVCGISGSLKGNAISKASSEMYTILTKTWEFNQLSASSKKEGEKLLKVRTQQGIQISMRRYSGVHKSNTTGSFVKNVHTHP